MMLWQALADTERQMIMFHMKRLASFFGRRQQRVSYCLARGGTYGTLARYGVFGSRDKPRAMASSAP